MTTKFKKGATVRSMWSDDWTHGLTGRVVRDGDEPGDVLVRFSKDDAEGQGHGKDNREWYINEDDLELVAHKARKAPHGPQEYKGNGKHAWELVVSRTGSDAPSVHRLRVPGGWIYKPRFSGGVFVPTPEAIGYKV